MPRAISPAMSRRTMGRYPVFQPLGPVTTRTVRGVTAGGVVVVCCEDCVSVVCVGCWGWLRSATTTNLCEAENLGLHVVRVRRSSLPVLRTATSLGETATGLCVTT